ncbi:MAG: DNA glycosylase [Dehalococcoidales bacterium]|nr:DNA glycosylase [Dehalococcoidales bacterium]
MALEANKTAKRKRTKKAEIKQEDDENDDDADEAMLDADSPAAAMPIPAVKLESSSVDVLSFFTASSAATSTTTATTAAAATSAAATAAIARMEFDPTEEMNMQDDVQVKLEPMDTNEHSSAGATSSSVAASSSCSTLAASSFTALPSPADPLYIGVLGRSVISFRQTADDVLYTVHHHQSLDTPNEATTTPAVVDAMLRDYFHLPAMQLDADGMPQHADLLLSHLYPAWCRLATDRFKFIAAVYPGVRVLRQDPIECLLSFICSSNNNVSRITLMLDALRSKYGTPLTNEMTQAELDQIGGKQLCAFPTLEQLAQNATEEQLRKLGFGYRAKYIVQSVTLLREKGGGEYLLALRRSKSRQEVESALLEFAGVGPKVASCVALFCLDRLDAIPVDTHVWKIALRDYAVLSAQAGMDLHQVKSLTPKVMEHVGDVFRSVFGQYAGWAHCLLFLAELPDFKRRLKELGLNVHHPPVIIKQKKVKKTTNAIAAPAAAPSSSLSHIDDAEMTESDEESKAIIKTKRQKSSSNKSAANSSSSLKVKQKPDASLSRAFKQAKA